MGVALALAADATALIAAPLPGSVIGLGAIAGPTDAVDSPIVLKRFVKLLADGTAPKLVRFDVLTDVAAL